MRSRQSPEWLPVHHWSLDQVWNRIHASGIAPHWAHGEGMSGLSCSFCPLASRRDLLTACRLRPDLGQTYAAPETRIGHRFQNHTTMTELLDQSAARRR